jgi:hypothetical protein
LDDGTFGDAHRGNLRYRISCRASISAKGVERAGTEKLKAFEVAFPHALVGDRFSDLLEVGDMFH